MVNILGEGMRGVPMGRGRAAEALNVARADVWQSARFVLLPRTRGGFSGRNRLMQGSMQTLRSSDATAPQMISHGIFQTLPVA